MRLMPTPAPKFGTLAIHAGEGRDPVTNAHNTPIYQTATFTFETAEDMIQAVAEPLDHFFYSRTGNPTTAVLEKKLAALEGSEEALVTASGMAAVAIAACATTGKSPRWVAEWRPLKPRCGPTPKSSSPRA